MLDGMKRNNKKTIQAEKETHPALNVTISYGATRIKLSVSSVFCSILALCFCPNEHVWLYLLTILLLNHLPPKFIAKLLTRLMSLL